VICNKWIVNLVGAYTMMQLKLQNQIFYCQQQHLNSIKININKENAAVISKKIYIVPIFKIIMLLFSSKIW